MLYEEVEKYVQLSGDKDALNTSVSRIGGYLDGYDKGLEVLDKIRAEIDKARFIDKDTRICKNANASGLEVALQIIDKYKAESEKYESSRGNNRNVKNSQGTVTQL